MKKNKMSINIICFSGDSFYRKIMRSSSKMQNALKNVWFEGKINVNININVKYTLQYPWNKAMYFLYATGE